ncbi:MBT domain-containing protein 1-like isoform X2 [Liolophura sinensis]|uniref:MBT domain-containing protein 1-like isoform X2 n=1 Tax=Liolophura sinensis TaxID=3198878 RepID=UPI0031582936
MDPGDTDWSRWSTQSDMESGLDMVKAEDSVISSETRSDNIGDGSNLGADDDYMTKYGLYDGYDSYNDVSESSDDGEGMEPEVVQESPVYTPPVGQKTEYRFMNGKDGMATCEMCGAIGIKHAFYSKSKRFCSLACSRGFAAAQKEGKLLSMQNRVQVKVEPGTKSKPKYTKPSPVGNAAMLSIGGNSKQGNGKSFDWATFLSATNAQAASVNCFKHCPMSDCWENINEGMKVEVINHDCDLANTVYWIATVIKVAGYKAQLRYEGYGNDQSNDFWINLSSQDVHPVGWCATIGKPLVPPQTIQHKYTDWKDFLVRRLTGARTLPSNFYHRVIESINNHKFKKGIKVEVVDKMCVSAMRVAVVDEVIGGRLRLQYQEKAEENDDFWCHMRSSLLHPIGWSQHVGHILHASQEYKNKSLGKVTMQKYDPDDATPDMFRSMKEPPSGLKFQVGMKLEAIDPLNLATICVSTVMKVLKDKYLMIGIDGSMAQSGSDWFCYHSSSPCIFPAGFCEINDLDLTPPKGYKGQFKWFDYLRQTKSSAAPVKLFDKEIPKHGFKPGMKVEAVDLMEPRLICVGTVVKVVGRLLRIHFDGWESDYDQWVDCETPDLYPVGWCEMMGYNLEGPRVRDVSQPSPHIIPKKRKGKTQIYRGPRKKRKPKGGGKPVKVLSDKTNQRTALPFHVKSEQQFSLSNELMSATLPPLIDQGNHKSGETTSSQVSAGKAVVKEEEEMETDTPPALSPQSSASGPHHTTGVNGQMPELAGHMD